MSKAFGLLLIICGVWFLLHARTSKTKSKAAMNWPKTKARILSSKVVKAPGAKPTVYRAQITYQYNVNGQAYSNNKLTLGGEVNSGRPKAQRRCDQYPDHSEQDVFFNPENPQESFLITQAEGLVFELVGGLFGLILGLLLLAGIFPAQ